MRATVIVEQLVFEPPLPRVSAEDLGLVLLELLGHEALPGRQRLPTYIVLGHSPGLGPRHLDAVEIWQTQIEDDNIRMICNHAVDRLLSIGGLINGKAFGTERGAQITSNGGFIVHNQNSVKRIAHK